MICKDENLTSFFSLFSFFSTRLKHAENEGKFLKIKFTDSLKNKKE